MTAEQSTKKNPRYFYQDPETDIHPDPETDSPVSVSTFYPEGSSCVVAVGSSHRSRMACGWPVGAPKLLDAVGNLNTVSKIQIISGRVEILFESGHRFVRIIAPGDGWLEVPDRVE